MAKIAETPNKTQCISFPSNCALDLKIERIMSNEIKGSYQEEFVNTIINQGYDMPDNNLRGNASKYKGRYQTSIFNLITRINIALSDTKYKIVCGSIGPKGGYGYYITYR